MRLGLVLYWSWRLEGFEERFGIPYLFFYYFQWCTMLPLPLFAIAWLLKLPLRSCSSLSTTDVLFYIWNADFNKWQWFFFYSTILLIFWVFFAHHKESTTHIIWGGRGGLDLTLIDKITNEREKCSKYHKFSNENEAARGENIKQWPCHARVLCFAWGFF